MSLSFFFSLSRSEDIPKWPSTYHLRGVWSIPYQKINVPFFVQTDYIKNRQNQVSYENLLNEVQILNSATYYLQESPSGKNCHVAWYNSPDPDELVEYLPRNSSEWTFLSDSEVVNGKRCKGWHQVSPYRKDWYNRFYVDYETDEPVRYYMHGPSIRGSHASDYIFDIYEFGTEIKEEYFILPNTCVNSTESASSKKARDIHAARSMKKSNDQQCEFIQETKIDNLPTNFSWRNVPNVLPYPHDQAVCGSCWAQGTMGAISAALSLKAGKNVVSSVQQVIDCTWGHLNFACDGGEQDDAMDRLIKGETLLATDEEYPYIGIGGQCANNFKNTVGKVVGCKQVPPNDNELLKTVLYKYGPLAVAIVADQSGFSTLGSEIYDNDQCTTKLNKIDHTVLLTGWAKVGDKEAWEIENSWSDVWGNKGFGLIAMGEHDCGITEDAILPIVEYEEHTYA